MTEQDTQHGGGGAQEDIVRSSQTELIDEEGRKYIRHDASAHAGFYALVLGGGLGAGVGLFAGLFIGGVIP